MNLLNKTCNNKKRTTFTSTENVYLPVLDLNNCQINTGNVTGRDPNDVCMFSHTCNHCTFNTNRPRRCDCAERETTLWTLLTWMPGWFDSELCWKCDVVWFKHWQTTGSSRQEKRNRVGNMQKIGKEAGNGQKRVFCTKMKQSSVDVKYINKYTCIWKMYRLNQSTD